MTKEQRIDYLRQLIHVTELRLIDADVEAKDLAVPACDRTENRPSLMSRLETLQGLLATEVEALESDYEKVLTNCTSV